MLDTQISVSTSHRILLMLVRRETQPSGVQPRLQIFLKDASRDRTPDVHGKDVGTRDPSAKPIHQEYSGMP